MSFSTLSDTEKQCAQIDRPWLEPAPRTLNRRLSYKERVQIHTLCTDAGWDSNDIAIYCAIPYRTVARCLT